MEQNNDKLSPNLYIPFLMLGASFFLSAVFFILVDVFKMMLFKQAAYVFLTLFNLAGLGVVTVLTWYINRNRKTLLVWLKLIALIAFALGAMDSVRNLQITSGLLAWSPDFPITLRRVDPLGILPFWGSALFLLIFNLKGKKKKLIPGWLAIVGAVYGGVLFAPPITEILSLQKVDAFMPLYSILAFASLPLSAVWGIGMGLFLRKKLKEQ